MFRGGGDDNSESIYNVTVPLRVRPVQDASRYVWHDKEQLDIMPMPPWRRSADESDAVQEISTHRRFRPSDYQKVVPCNSRQWSWTRDDVDDDLSSDAFDVPPMEKTFADRENPYVDYRGRLNGSRKLSHSPVVYQYYGRSRTRGNSANSVHFILLGPNVDHWKAVGQVLAARGFNTIACERLKSGSGDGNDANEDAPNLVLDVLEALKWKKAIIVGCDTESVLAMETAMMLSPDQVVGLVMAGDLASADQVAAAAAVGDLESFLQRVLDCPFLIVSDTDSPTLISGSSAHKAIEAHSNSRCLILGGGSAPHRLKPEQFAWVLTRFVEEKLEVALRREALTPKPRPANVGAKERNYLPGSGLLRALNLPFGINSLVYPEGRLLLGRAVAAGLFYITAMRVIVIQYGILRAGLIAIKSKYESIDALTKKGIQAIGSFIVNFGYIPRLFTLKRANDDEEDENRRSGTIVLPDEQDDEKEPEEKSRGKDASTDDDDPTEEIEQESKQNDDQEGDNSPPADEEPERPPLFKPFFFLDNVVT